MLREEILPLNDPSEEKIKHAISLRNFSGLDILKGENDHFEFRKSIPDNSVNSVVRSLSYNISKVYAEKVKLEKYLKFQSEIAGEYLRILKDKITIT